MVEASLVRAMGVRTLSASIVNATVGAGIFVLPAAAAGQLGSAVPLAYLLCAATMGLIVTCFAMAGSRVALTGGLYAYVEVAFGPYVGFLSGVLLWLSCALGVAGVVSALAASVGVFVPAVGQGPGRAVFIVGLFGLLALTNIRGVRPAGRLVEVMTVAKLAPLLVFVAIGLFFMRPDVSLRPTLPAADALGDTVLLLIFAFIGLELALVPSGEVVRPSRTVPRAIFVALGVVTLLYLGIQLVAQGVLGADLALFGDAPLVEAAGRFLGPPGSALLLAGASVSMLGYASGDMLGAPRLLFAFGRDGLLPPVFARVHPVFRTPAVAIATHATLVCALALVGTFGALALLTNIVTLTVYLFCCAGAWELQRRDVRAGGVPFHVPGGPLVPLLACAAILWILSHATWQELAAEAGTVVVATLLFLLRPARWRAIQG